MLKAKKENLINEKRPHESAVKHVSGVATPLTCFTALSCGLFSLIRFSFFALSIQSY